MLTKEQLERKKSVFYVGYNDCKRDVIELIETKIYLIEIQIYSKKVDNLDTTIEESLLNEYNYLIQKIK